MAEYGRKRLQNTSGDPRLVKLDGQDSPVPRNHSQATRSHVVSMLNDKIQSQDNKIGQRLKPVSRDVVIPSLNSPANVKEESFEKKTVSNSSSDGVIHTRKIGSSFSPDESNDSRDQSNRSFDELGQSREHSRQSRTSSGQSRDELQQSCDRLQKLRGQWRKSHDVHSNRSCDENENTFWRDIETCLNTLDYLKAVLRTTMVS